MIELSDTITSYIKNNFGEKYLEKYKDFFQGKYNPYLRVSPFTDPNKLIESLKSYGIKLEKVNNVPNCFRILEGDDVAGKTLEFILGQYYIQSLSSMIPPLVLNPKENEMVLDMCAAPGSKTTQIAEMMNNRGTLIANEISLDRVKSLIFNIDKMNFVNIGVMKYNGELLGKIFENQFDKILVDAPCSALGIIQKRGEVSNWWNEKKVKGITEIQFKLLVSAIKTCKVGGEIVYSTCTLTLEENELILDKILKKYPVELIDIDLSLKSKEAFTKYQNEDLNPSITKARRIVPWDIESEGFFISKLRKLDNTGSLEKYPGKDRKLELLKPSSNNIKRIINEIAEYYGIPFKIFERYNYIVKMDDIYFVDRNWICGNLEIFLRIGSKLGSIDKRNSVQLHTLGAQTLGKYAGRNVILLENQSELETYFAGRVIKKKFETTGQKIVKYNDYILGTAVVSTEGLKSQFPRAFRTQEIVFK